MSVVIFKVRVEIGNSTPPRIYTYGYGYGQWPASPDTRRLLRQELIQSRYDKDYAGEHQFTSNCAYIEAIDLAAQSPCSAHGLEIATQAE